MSVLLLNASFEPLSVIPTRRALTLVWSGKAEMVEGSGDSIRSADESHPVPAVVRLRNMVRVPFRRTVPLNRRTLRARDGGRCQVAGCARAGSTIDHLVPKSRGGGHAWENTVLMCQPHNRAKRDRLLSELGWRLKAKPRAPRGPWLVLRHPHRAEPIPPAWAPYVGAAAAP